MAKPNIFEDRGDHIAIVVFSRKHGRKEILVDKSDWNQVEGIRWCAARSGKLGRFYAVGYIGTSREDNRLVRMHQLLTGFPETDTDHRNFNGLDNRRFNLFVTTRSKNMLNRRGPRTDNTSGFLGVSWDSERKLWFAEGANHQR